MDGNEEDLEAYAGYPERVLRDPDAVPWCDLCYPFKLAQQLVPGRPYHRL